MSRQQASSAAFILCMGFMALVSTIALSPRAKTSSSMAGRSRFMNGSPPVKPISLVPWPSRSISSRKARTSAADR